MINKCNLPNNDGKIFYLNVTKICLVPHERAFSAIPSLVLEINPVFKSKTCIKCLSVRLCGVLIPLTNNTSNTLVFKTA